jgi:hypothetical protein
MRRRDEPCHPRTAPFTRKRIARGGTDLYYLAGQRLQRFAEKMQARAEALGIKEEDIPGLVQEVRRENKALGR